VSTADTLPMTLPARSNDRAIKPLSDATGFIERLDDHWRLCQILVNSGMLPRDIRTPESALAIMLKGRELGIGPMAAFAGITVIQGKPVVSPQLMLSLINRSGLMEDMKIEDDGETCRVTMKRKGRSPHTAAFSMQNAREMQLAGKDNWKKMGAIMRQWRAAAACSRIVFPDVIDGMYLPEEMGADVNEDGEIIDGEIVAEARIGPKFASNDSGHGTSGSYASPAQVKVYKAFLANLGKEMASRWADAWVSSNRDFPPGLPEYPFSAAAVSRSILVSAVREGKLAPVEMTTDPETGESIPRASIEQVHQMVALVHEREPRWFEATARGAFSWEMGKVATAFVRDHPSYCLPPEYEAEVEDVPAEEESQEVAPPSRKMGKRELAESVKARLEAEAKADRYPITTGPIDPPWEEGRM
jgi:hypothetical protein